MVCFPNRGLQLFFFAGWLFACGCIAPAALIYVGALDGNIRTVNSTGGQVTNFATGAGHVSGLAFDNNQNLFVAEFTENRIGKMTPGGVVSNFATISQASGVVVDSAGNIYATAPGTTGPGTNGTIHRISPAGVITTLYTPLYFPQELAIDTLDNLYEYDSSNGRIHKITQSGVRSTYATITGANGVTGLCFDGSGNLFASSVSTVYKITSSGVVTTHTSSVPGASGLVFDKSAGILYSTNTFNGDIYAINSSGAVSVIANVGLVNPTSVAIAVPEPAGGALIAVVGMSLAARRKRRSSVTRGVRHV
jgi:hypothetical protein